MRFIFSYMKRLWGRIAAGMSIKLIGTLTELALPYILEHIIDDLVPLKQMDKIMLWGLLMIIVAVATWQINVFANRIAIKNARQVSYEVRRDLFNRTLGLSGNQFDDFSLPSLISRMTSDSYNVQSFVQVFQTLCIRAPITMIGGIIIALTMDRMLASILCIMLPILLLVIIGVSVLSIPLYNLVQQRLDDLVRILRENITGIRVVKALSKRDYEIRRFQQANEHMKKTDIKASTVLALPGPFMQLCLNIGLTLVVYFGAVRVNEGLAKPGVVLAFLTYFNMIIQGAMAFTRIFTMLSKAAASADRIALVIQAPETQPVLAKEVTKKPEDDELIRFEHVNFSYGSMDAESDRELCLKDISFSIRKGESLGIIGPTGCGKTTIINLLMRFYDVPDGGVYVGGRDVRTWDKDELRRKFGIAMQNDVVFHDTIRENISFGRDVGNEQVEFAAENAMASEYIKGLNGKYDFMVDMKGMNLSGGQRQRLLVARALAADPEILILDDSSSALDYQTDAALRKALGTFYPDTTKIIVAQRVSSIQNMTRILVLDNGQCIGYGTHEELLATCDMYRDIYQTQMGALA